MAKKEKMYSQNEVIKMSNKDLEDLSCKERIKILSQMEKTDSYKEARSIEKDINNQKDLGCKVKLQKENFSKTKKGKLLIKVKRMRNMNAIDSIQGKCNK